MWTRLAGLLVLVMSLTTTAFGEVNAYLTGSNGVRRLAKNVKVFLLLKKRGRRAADWWERQEW
jgi:hypothetical protein